MLVSKRATNILLVLILAVGIGIVAMLATGARGGPLDPQGPPSSTYKSLEIVPPIWVLTLPADDGPDACNSRRFTCVMNGEAVLDRETGLVWQQTPFSVGYKRDWLNAFDLCGTSETGGRRGWRLPTLEEMSTLFLNTSPFPGLPDGNPFDHAILLTDTRVFWTRTEWGSGAIAFVFGAPTGGYVYSDKIDNNRVWCVRAPGASVDNG